MFEVSMKDLLEVTGFLDDQNLKTFEEIKNSRYPRRILEVLVQKLQPDYIYDFEGKPLVLFKKLNNVDFEQFSKTIWNFNESPVVFLLLPTEIVIINGYFFEQEKMNIVKNKILSLKDDVFAKVNKWTILSGEIYYNKDNISKAFQKVNRVDSQLLKDLELARNFLIKNSLSEEISNALISRCLFIQYLVDRGALNSIPNRDIFLKYLLIKDKLYQLFSYLREKFNGDMFPITDSEQNFVKDIHLEILFDLFSGVNLETRQKSLFNIFDFSIIPVELISNIYERFLSNEAKIEDKAVYTPIFLVDFVFTNTLDEILEERDPLDVKVLDPACGSGIFLVESFRKIYTKWLNNNISSSPEQRATILKVILENNIFGIDINANSIDVAIFSLYIATLDYLEPKDIETNGFKFPNMKESTLFVGDFFAEDQIFNEKLAPRDFCNDPLVSAQVAKLN